MILRSGKLSKRFIDELHDERQDEEMDLIKISNLIYSSSSDKYWTV